MKDSLSNYLKNKFIQSLKKKQQTNRRLDRFEIHATDIPSLCVREAMILYTFGIPLRKPMDYPPKTYLTFRIGEKIEDIVREALDGRKPPPMAIKIGKIYIVGSPDILFKNKFIIECKSIKKDAFEELRNPFEKHVAQLSFYLWLAEKCPNLNYSTTGAIVYVPKEEASDVIKVFPVTLSDAYRRYYTQFVESVKQFLKTRKLPERACQSINSPTARNCSVVKYCFKTRR